MKELYAYDLLTENLKERSTVTDSKNRAHHYLQGNDAGKKNPTKY
jgi:hypothetical protein